MQTTPPNIPAQGPEDGAAKERRRAHLKTVIEAVLATGELDDPRWDELAVVFSVSNGGKNFGNSGYAYGENGAWWAVSFPVLAVRPPVLEYLRDLRDPLPQGLVRVVLQYNRTNKRARLEPEFDNPDRWMITPDTARSMVDELRPGF
jgi:hypothetical protein